MRKTLLCILLCVVALTLASCWASKQQMYATVTNTSGVKLLALEVHYPGGIYGGPELAPGQSHRKWVAIMPPCEYSVNFEDTAGKSYKSQLLNFGKDKCPNEVILTIDSTMKLSGSAVSR